MKRFGRPSLLLLTAISAIGSTVAHGVGVMAAAPAAQAPPTRLGVAVKTDMASRDQTVAGQNRGLDLRERAARATEARIKASLAAHAAAATPKPGAPPPDAGEQFDSLARIYQAMKPGPAATVFQQLDLDVQIQVAKRMRDRSVAMMMASMSPRAATILSMALARKSADVVIKPAVPSTPAAVPSTPPAVPSTAAPAAVAAK